MGKIKHKIEILHKGSVTSQLKSAGSKNCSLCMAEKVNIFYKMNKKGGKSNKLMKKRLEIYGSCTCKTDKFI